METITFSDSVELTGQGIIGQNTDNVVFSENLDTSALSFEEYCKRHPESFECLEYDV